MNAARRLSLGRDADGRRVRRSTGPKTWTGRCELTYDLGPELPAPSPGDLIVTTARSHYLVVTCRQVTSAVHPRRFALVVDRIDPQAAATVEAHGARVYPLHWYRR